LNEAIIPLAIIFGWIILSLIVGILAGIKKKFTLEGYLVSGRALGLVLIYVLMTGEIYSAYAFLGAAGWGYSYGMAIMYSLGYGCLAYSFGYFLAGFVWKLGKKFRYATQADFFNHRYNSRWLAILVALVGIVFSIPYLQLQLQGLSYILHAGSLGYIPIWVGIVVGMVVMITYVYSSGLKGISWVNLLQATLMFLIAWVLLLAIPFKEFGSLSLMFESLPKSHLTLHGSMGIPWYVSTLILCGLGFFMYPQMYPAIYGAKDLKTLKRNYVLLPLFSLFMIPVVLAGLTVAALGVKLATPDEAVLIATKIAYPSWILGVVGAAGFAAASSTASAILLTISGLLSKNIYGIAKPGATDRELTLVSRISVILIGIAAMLLALYAAGRLVGLILLAYAGVTQMFPGVVLGLFWKRMNKWAAGAGIIAGIGTIAYLKFFGPGDYLGIHFGLWGLMINIIVVLIVAFITSSKGERFQEVREAIK